MGLLEDIGRGWEVDCRFNPSVYMTFEKQTFIYNFLNSGPCIPGGRVAYGGSLINCSLRQSLNLEHLFTFTEHTQFHTNFARTSLKPAPETTMVSVYLINQSSNEVS